MTQVFISYRHTSPDQDLAGSIEAHLKRHGFAVFIDTQLLVGDEWADEIKRQLIASQHFVVLLSQESIRSHMVRKEVELAHELRKQRGQAFTILPVRVSYFGELPYDLGAYLDPIQYAKWQESDPFETIAEQILAAIQRRAELPNQGKSGDAKTSDTGLEALANATENRGAPLPAADPRLMFDKGTMKAGSPFYIRREADAQIESRIQLAGETIIVKGMRQMGKSSLLAAAMASARGRKQKTFYVDFQLTDHEHLQLWTSYSIAWPGDWPTNLKQRSNQTKHGTIAWAPKRA